MSADIRTVLERGAARPHAAVDVDAVLTRSRQIGRRRGIATVTALAVVLPAVVLGASLAARDGRSPVAFARYPGTKTVVAGPDNVLPLPDVGDVVAGVLNDGTRVYAVRHAEADVTVVEAVDTHVPYGLQKQIGWCRTSQQFEEVLHGSRWDARGRYVFGPAPRDLTTYAVETRGDEIHVKDRTEATARSRGSSPGGPMCHGAGDVGSREEQALIGHALFADHPKPAAPLVPLDDVIDRRVKGVVAVDALVELAGTHLLLCPRARPGVPSGVCAEPGLRVPLASLRDGRDPAAMIGPVRLLLDLGDGTSPLTSRDVVRLVTVS